MVRKRRITLKRLVLAAILLAVTLSVLYFTAPPERQEQVQSAAGEVAVEARQAANAIKERIGGRAGSGSPGQAHQFHVHAGLPVPTTYPHPLLVLTNRGFIVGYDEQRKNPAWVAYRLYTVQRRTLAPRPSKFLTDERTKAGVSHDDYTRSGYDRGHMAPNSGIGQCYGDEAQRETFLLSNIVPQKPALNQRLWRLLEERMETKYAMRLEEIWITTGPVYDAKRQNLASGIEIPDAFFQITIDEQEGIPRVLSFLVPHTVQGDEPHERFLTSIDQIEQATGLDFNAALPDDWENAIEAFRATALW